MARLDGKVIFISGATSGTGIEIAKRCINEGAVVGIAGLQRENGEAVASEPGDSACFFHLDVREQQSWDRAIDEVIQVYGRLDALVNNAGISELGNEEQADMRTFSDVFATNAGGTMLGCGTAIRATKDRGTPMSLINIASATAKKTSSWTCIYGASKAAILSISKSIALHCAEQKYPIRCNSVLPGIMMTPMVEETSLQGKVGQEREAVLEELAAAQPIGRMIECIEVANVVAFLASDESTGMTGAEIAVDGGIVAS